MVSNSGGDVELPLAQPKTVSMNCFPADSDFVLANKYRERKLDQFPSVILLLIH